VIRELGVGGGLILGIRTRRLCARLYVSSMLGFPVTSSVPYVTCHLMCLPFTLDQTGLAGPSLRRLTTSTRTVWRTLTEANLCMVHSGGEPEASRAIQTLLPSRSFSLNPAGDPIMYFDLFLPFPVASAPIQAKKKGGQGKNKASGSGASTPNPTSGRRSCWDGLEVEEKDGFARTFALAGHRELFSCTA
jgi:hypothetical protein